MKPELERALEARIGLSLAEVRAMPLAEFRARVERRKGKQVEFQSYFPLIGRGTVSRKVLTGEVLNAEIDAALAAL